MKRSRSPCLLQSVLLILLSGAIREAHAAKLIDVSVLDKDYLVVHLSDGDVVHNEGVGETVTRCIPELDSSAAVEISNWTITSLEDANYGTAGKHPQNCYRKKKLSGHVEEDEAA
jgi:hypothetical protein